MPEARAGLRVVRNRIAGLPEASGCCSGLQRPSPVANRTCLPRLLARASSPLSSRAQRGPCLEGCGGTRRTRATWTENEQGEAAAQGKEGELFTLQASWLPSGSQRRDTPPGPACPPPPPPPVEREQSQRQRLRWS
eukprot:768078-Hanusia_phi.AAC.4